MLPHTQVAFVLGVQEVTDSLTVNLHVADLHRVGHVVVGGVVDSREEVFAELWNDALLVLLLFPHHDVGLAGPRLPIGKDAHIVALKGML